MKSCLLFFLLLQIAFSAKAQSGFDALWKKYDSIQKATEIKSKPNVSEEYKTIPTVDARKDSVKTDSAIKKITTEITAKPVEVKKSDSLFVKEKPEVKKSAAAYKNIPTIVNIPKKDSVIKKIADKPVVKEKPVVVEKPKPIEKKTETAKVPEKPVKPEVPAKPVIKEVEKQVVKKEKTTPGKSNFDTTKAVKDFSFETTPIVNGNATYNKPDPIKPIGANEIDDKIPVNKPIISKGNTKEDVLAKTNYSEFSKEAETIRRNNDKKLDSVLKTMQLNIPVQFNPNDYVDIYVNGGCILKDDNSKLYDRISILNAGRIHREYKSKKTGDQRVEKNISREQLVKLAQYIIDLGFFDFKPSYDCDENDAACNTRLTTNPVALPLQITVTIGERKSKVYVAVYSLKSEKNWVNYPANLDKIMSAIYSIIEK